jgi:protein tyrosine/serine phosphatase
MPEGLVNFRDIAAVAEQHGYRVTPGVFYRADNLGHLSPRGTAELAALGVRAVVDLRRPEEAEKYPSRITSEPDIAYYHFDVVGDVPELLSRGDTISSTVLEERNSDGAFTYPVDRLVQIYTMIIDRRAETMRKLFSTMSRVDGPTVFHCVAGQDRTGIVAAILLRLAGVSVDAVAADYGATADYNHERYVAWDLPAKTGLPIFDAESYRAQLCPPEAIIRTVEHLDTAYAGAAAYLAWAGLSSGEIRTLEGRLTTGTPLSVQ